MLDEKLHKISMMIMQWRARSMRAKIRAGRSDNPISINKNHSATVQFNQRANDLFELTRKHHAIIPAEMNAVVDKWKAIAEKHKLRSTAFDDEGFRHMHMTTSIINDYCAKRLLDIING
jgi:hypothetical protein